MEHTMPYANSNGWNIWYEAIGSGPPLVCTGGPIMMHNQFDYVNELLARHYTVINWNWRGAGQSDRTWVSGIGFDDFVADLGSVMDALGVGKAHFWGASSGSALAIRYAAKHPERVARMVLFPWHIANAMTSTRAETLRSTGIERAVWNAYYVATSQEAFDSGEVIRMVKQEIEVARRNTPIDVLERVSGVMSGYDLSTDVARLTAPILLLVGGSGRFGAAESVTRARIDAFQELLPAAELVVIPRAGGTLPMLEQPEASVQAVRDFLGN